MFIDLIVRLVDASRRHAWPLLAASLIATLALGAYVATHIKINTDVNQLLAADLDWRQREVDMDKAFPQATDRLVIVIDGKTGAAAETAATAMAAKLAAMPELFQNVTRPDAIPFFRKNGFLFLNEQKLTDILDMMVKAQPLLGTIAADPSLRGLFGGMGLVLQGLQAGEVTYDKLAAPFATLADLLDAVKAGRDEPFAWQSLAGNTGEKPSLRETRKFILTQPVLDYGDLEPGAKAQKAVRAAAQELNLTADNGITVRMTGSVALNDDEFASVADGTTFATILSVVLVLVILFLALRSARLIVPILLTLFVGLIATTAFAMASVGSLNLISVAFAVMFVGIAVDFGIQFGVRYRDVHHQEPDRNAAMLITARQIGEPLALAAGSTAVGFFAFIPTAYRGVAELGLIAGAGMIIAFLLNITLLPALLAVFVPPAEPEAIGFKRLKPLDQFILQKRRPLLIVIAAVALIAGGVAAQLRFDFDPLNLKDPKSESLSTLFSLMEDPDATPYTVAILAKDLDEAKTLAAKIDALPQVDHTITLASFIPEDQEKKLALIQDANFILAPTLNPAAPLPAPTTEESAAAMKKAAADLQALGPDKPEAQRLARALAAIAATKDAALFARLHHVLISGIEAQIAQARDALSAEAVTPDQITDDLRRDWIAADGRAKIEVYPKGNPRDPDVLAAFTKAVQSVAPAATGPALSIQESGRTISRAFIQAGIGGILAIALLIWVVLRDAGLVVRLLAPLFLAGALTLATMVAIRLPLNFANVIALPLLLSLGVSYAIYFITYWRQGGTGPLGSSMARAVLFSACTTLVAFGSLSLSAHPGTAGMGKLLTIALLYSLTCTFIVLPVLLGSPHSRKKDS